MNKKYSFYAAMTCFTFIVFVMFIVFIIDMLMDMNWKLVLGMSLCFAGCLPLWLIMIDLVAQYYESVDKRNKRRRLVIVPYSAPTKSASPIVFPEKDDIKVYSKQNDVELRQLITTIDSEADTQIYSIKKTK